MVDNDERSGARDILEFIGGRVVGEKVKIIELFGQPTSIFDTNFSWLIGTTRGILSMKI